MAVPRGVNRRAAPWLVWNWAGRELTLLARTGQQGTLVRATRNAYTQDASGILHESVDRAPVWGHYFDTSTNLYKPGGLALHGAGQELTERSTDITNAVYGWNNTGRFTFSDAASIIGGKVAKRAVNDNTAASCARTWGLGTPGAVTRTIWLLIETVDALTCDVGLASSIDTFTSGIRGQLTFATGAAALIAGAGSVKAHKFSPTVWLLTASRTLVAGHGYTAVYYLTGTSQNAHTSIVHGQGLVVATFPLIIPTVGATLSRDADELSWPLNVTPGYLATTGFTFYDSYIVQRHPSGATMDCVMVGENDVGGSNALMVSMDTASSRMTARWQTPAGNNSSTVAPAGFSTLYVPGALVERCVTVTPAGSATAFLRINGGAIGAGTPTAAIGFPTAWDVSAIHFADTVTADRKGHRLAIAGGLAIGVRSLDDMAEVCA